MASHTSPQDIGKPLLRRNSTQSIKDKPEKMVTKKETHESNRSPKEAYKAQKDAATKNACSQKRKPLDNWQADGYNNSNPHAGK